MTNMFHAKHSLILAGLFLAGTGWSAPPNPPAIFQAKAVAEANARKVVAELMAMKGREAIIASQETKGTVGAAFKKIFNADGSGVFDISVQYPHLPNVHGNVFANVPAGDVRDRRLSSVRNHTQEVWVFEEPDQNPFDHQGEVTWKKKADGFSYQEEVDGTFIPALIARSCIPGWRQNPIANIIQWLNQPAHQVFQEPETADLTVTMPGLITTFLPAHGKLSEDKRSVTWNLAKRGLDDTFILKIECGPETDAAKAFRSKEYARLVDDADEAPAVPVNPGMPGVKVKKKFVAALGARISDLETDEMEGPARRGGVKIISLDDDSAAKKAGLKEGDIVLRLNGSRIKDFAKFKTALKKLQKAGETKVTLSVARGGKEEDLPEFTPPE